MTVVAPAVVGPALRVHPHLAELAGELDRAAVRWAVLRVPEGGFAAPSGDIDAIVHPGDRTRALRIFRALSFVRLPRGGPDVHFLRYCQTSDQWLWIHLAADVGFGRGRNLPFEGANGCLTALRTEEPLPLLAPDDALWLLLWHCLACKGAVAEHHRDALGILRLKADATSATARLFADACGDTTIAQRLLSEIECGAWSRVEALAPVFVEFARDPDRPWVIGTAVRAAHASATLIRGRLNRGFSVAIVGPDGAGKTTLVHAIRDSVPLPTRTIYMGLTGGALRYVQRLRVPGVMFAARAAIIWGRYARATYHRARGRLVLFERYTYDAVAPHPQRLTWVQRHSRALTGRLCPAPNLVLLLDAPGTVMFERKAEYDAATLEDWRQHFLSLRRFPYVEVVDATQPVRAVRADAVSRIWRRYAERLQTASGIHL